VLLMLDSSVGIEVMRARSGSTAERLIGLGSRRPRVSTIVGSDLERGVAVARQREHSRRRVVALLARREVRDFDLAAAASYGPVRARLNREGRQIRPLDMLIAAHALSLDRPLLTGHVATLRCLPGLRAIGLDEA
jgi:tRNA(fMet)-specific endonuclease VapC